MEKHLLDLVNEFMLRFDSQIYEAARGNSKSSHQTVHLTVYINSGMNNSYQR